MCAGPYEPWRVAQWSANNRTSARFRSAGVKARQHDGSTGDRRVGPGNRVTFTGTVTSGLFTGDTVLHTITGPATDVPLCTLGLGTVSSIYSIVTLEITSV
ncbi:hypothetical protein [Streptomyces sp. NPDC002644]